MKDHPLNTTRNNRARVVLVAQTRTQITKADADTIRVEAVDLIEELRKPQAADATDHLLTLSMTVVAQMTHDTKRIIDEVAEALIEEIMLKVLVIIQLSNEMKLTNFTRRKNERSKLRLKKSQLQNFKVSMWCPSPEK